MMDRSPLLRTALACWLLFALIALLVSADLLGPLDAAGMHLWRDAAGRPLGPDWLVAVMRWITDSGDGLPRLAVATLALVAALWARRWGLAAMLIAAAYPAPLINGWLKLEFARARPDLVPHLAGSGGYAFPSGHSFNSAAAFVAAALVLGALTGRTRAFLIGALVWAGLVAFSRVWLGVHWPSDALAGWLGGAGWAMAVFAAGARWPALADRP
jgi:undecaprenyl-diphosphatase